MQVKNFIAAAAVAALGVGAMGSAQAATTAQFQVTLQILAACTVSTNGSLAFPTTASGSAATLNATGTNLISVTCPSGTAYRIALQPSGSATDGTGNMSDGASHSIAYSLFQGANGSNPWGSASGNMASSTGTGSAQQYTVYGQVASSAYASAPAGSYSDMVTVSVNY